MQKTLWPWMRSPPSGPHARPRALTDSPQRQAAPLPPPRQRSASATAGCTCEKVGRRQQLDIDVGRAQQRCVLEHRKPRRLRPLVLAAAGFVCFFVFFLGGGGGGVDRGTYGLTEAPMGSEPPVLAPGLHQVGSPCAVPRPLTPPRTGGR